MYCEHCGCAITNLGNFCPQCGDKFHNAPGRGRSHLSLSSVKEKLARNLLTIVLSVAVIFAGTLLLWVLYKSGTGADYPAAADARKVLENLREKQLREASAEIVGFEKVGAESREVLGVLLYTVEYEAEIKYPKGLNLAFGHCIQPSTSSNPECQSFLSAGKIVRAKGETEKLHGQMIFKKADQGWQGEDGIFY